MTMHWHKTALAAGFTLSLIAAPAFAQSGVDNDYAKWDVNKDSQIDPQEWDTGWGQNGVFDRFDVNADRQFTQPEWDETVSGVETGSVGTSARPTFRDRFGADTYSTFDVNQDSILDQQEMSRGMFGAYDADQNGVIDQAEYDAFSSDLGNSGLMDQ